jgi:glycylpeptide N-tetradecanoyltransferase
MSRHEEEEHASSASEEELVATRDAGKAGTSSSQGGDPAKKKKKKRKSKASKALSAIVDKVSRGDDEGAGVPDELVGEVLDRMRQGNPEESKNLHSDEVRRTLGRSKLWTSLRANLGWEAKTEKTWENTRCF